MSTAPAPGARRWTALALPIVAVLVLFLIGRRATNAATVPAASVTVTPDAAPEADAPSEVAEVEVSRPAVEQLADGGLIVNLNLATEADLRRLPGVGPTRARKIVELRTHLGRFKSVDDLARIKGFGRATIRRLRPLTRTS